MKKTLALLLTFTLTVGMLVGCKNTASKNNFSDESKMQIVTTIFPEYDWVMNVLGENSDAFEVTLLLDNGTDLHSYQPTPEDILRISSCDIFVYVGGESDEWVEDALNQAVNPNLTAINLMEVLGDAAKEEEFVEGMETEEEEEEGEEEEGPEYDEHVWLSLKNASLFVDAITEAVTKKDEANKDTYETNAAAYKEKLSSLDKQFEETVAGAKRNTLLFGDRFPFRYLTDDYGLNYYAAFIGCSAETEASFSTISFLCDKSDELELPVVMVIDGSDEEIAKTIILNSASKDKKVLTLDSMQSVALKDIKNGTTYLSVMEKNLEVLKEALN